MKRLLLAAALCCSMACVKGVCYEKLDCPAPQVCSPGGVCILQEASPKPPMMRDAGPDAGDDEETGGSDDAEADAAPECPPLSAAVGDACAERDAL
jgi:hypothetical protein